MNAKKSAADLILAVLPVTAVESVKFSERTVLFVGKGSGLEAIDISSRECLSSLTVLHGQAIHGIVPLQTSLPAEGKVRCNLLVYGGRQIAWLVLDLHVFDRMVVSSSCKIVHRAVVKDWILCCKWIDVANLRASFLSAYNALYHVEADNGTRQLRCELVSDAVTLYLYSADFVQRNDGCYIVASGTALGQVLIWTCRFDVHTRTWNARRCFQFDGHRGSIFGVNISTPQSTTGSEDLFVASCSDDRMINIWNLPAVELEASSSNDIAINEFCQTNRPLIQTYAHLSRIWNVDLATISRAGSEQNLLMSTGEDGQAQSWMLHVNGGSHGGAPHLVNKYIDRHHAGKNIWARSCSYSTDGVSFSTGGADGRVIMRNYSNIGRADHNSQQFTQPFTAIQSSVRDLKPTRKRPFALKSYIVVASDQVLATSDGGHLLRGNIRVEGITWELVFSDPKEIPLIPSLNTVLDYAFFVRISDHTLCAFHLRNSNVLELYPVRKARIANVWVMPTESPVGGPLEACAVISYHDGLDFDVFWMNIDQHAITQKSVSSILLPSTFEVTSVFYDKHVQLMLCGSRSGALSIYANVSPSTEHTRPAVCHRRVHGEDTVTSICRLETDLQCGKQSFYLTTGRDGTYCAHEVDVTQPQGSRMRVVHQAAPPFGPNIEGGHVAARPDGTRAILLHGFRSTNFVVWDETHQAQVMSVDCGGPHRSWAFGLDESAAHGGTFLWTQAKTFAYYKQASADHRIIQQGGHGREIKALATRRLGKHRWLLATGSEDTDIRLFEYTDNVVGKGKMRNIATIRKHVTGLQSLHFSSDGKVLISAAGREELYAWHLSSVPVLGQGVVFACALQSADAQSDARIMSLDMDIDRQQFDDHGRTAYVIVAAFSNGRLKTIRLNPATETAKAHFTLLHQIDFGTICLTQARFAQGAVGSFTSDYTTIIGATNGCINICYNPYPFTTEHANKTLPTETIADAASSASHKIHQNSITALQVLSLTSTPPHHHLVVVVTGGDDNALAITLVTMSTSPPAPHAPASSRPQFKSLVVPKAHSAALTALQIIETPQTNTTANIISDAPPSPLQKTLTILTAGNDQRICIWSLTLDVAALSTSPPPRDASSGRTDYTTTRDLREVTLQFRRAMYTDVADVSALALLRDDDDDAHEPSATDAAGLAVVVVGVGIEVRSVRGL